MYAPFKFYALAQVEKVIFIISSMYHEVNKACIYSERISIL